jgi:acetyltransferase
MAETLSKQPRPKGPKLTIITNAGGPGVLATDALVEGGGELAGIAKHTVDELSTFLPGAWSHSNPVDVLGDAGPDRYAKTLDVIGRDENSDGMLVILTPQDMTDATQTAEHLKAYAKIEGKPVLASWMGGPDIAAGEAILNRVGIPTFQEPDAAARAFNYMWKYADNLKSLYETPTVAEANPDTKAAEVADAIIQNARKQKRDILTEFESKQLLAAYGIPTVETHIATSDAQAAEQAAKVGFPVVLKLHSETITHKTDVGGVKLNLGDAAAVKKAFNDIKESVKAHCGEGHFLGVTVQPMIKLKDAYEVIIGSSIDSQFGPVMLFGSGGQLVEVFKDRSLGLPPLTATLARRMMEQTKIYKALKGVRGRKPVDLDGLEKIMVRFSQLIVEQRWIKEIDINPLMASEERLIALDARVVVYGLDTPEDKLPKPAIRPYPRQYITQAKTKDNASLTVRPIRPEDEPMIVQFHQGLSERSVRMRFYEPLKLSQRVTHDRLVKVCFNDYDRELGLVAVQTDPKTQQSQIVGVCRLSKVFCTDGAEFAVVVSDAWQNKGLGTQLLKSLINVAKAEKLKVLAANILAENVEMQRVCEKVGFKIVKKDGEAQVKAELAL